MAGQHSAARSLNIAPYVIAALPSASTSLPPSSQPSHRAVDLDVCRCVSGYPVGRPTIPITCLTMLAGQPCMHAARQHPRHQQPHCCLPPDTDAHTLDVHQRAHDRPVGRPTKSECWPANSAYVLLANSLVAALTLNPPLTLLRTTSKAASSLLATRLAGPPLSTCVRMLAGQPLHAHWLSPRRLPLPPRR